MTNYIKNGNEQNEKLDDAKVLINQAIMKYKESLYSLASIKGVKEVDELKKIIQQKIEYLNKKVSSINDTKSTISTKAKNLKNAADKAAREKEAREKEEASKQITSPKRGSGIGGVKHEIQ